MKKRWFAYICLVLTGLASSSCFGSKPPGTVRAYKDGVVYMRKGSYRVGPLPATWVRQPFNYKSLLFVHSKLGSTISTNAFCGENFDDASLEVLARHLYIDIEKVKVLSQREQMIDRRRSLWTIWSGRLDGVPVQLETVSIKEHNCLFDFYYVASPEQFEAAEKDFRRFVEGFAYP